MKKSSQGERSTTTAACLILSGWCPTARLHPVTQIKLIIGHDVQASPSISLCTMCATRHFSSADYGFRFRWHLEHCSSTIFKRKPVSSVARNTLWTHLINRNKSMWAFGVWSLNSNKAAPSSAEIRFSCFRLSVLRSPKNHLSPIQHARKGKVLIARL